MFGDALNFLKQKVGQGLSDVEQWGSDAGNDVTNAVKSVFQVGAPPTTGGQVSAPAKSQGQSQSTILPQNPATNPALNAQQNPAIQNSQAQSPKPVNISANPNGPTNIVAQAPVKVAGPQVPSVNTTGTNPNQGNNQEPGFLKQFTNVIAAPVNLGKAIVGEVTGNPTAELNAANAAQKEAGNNIITNTAKGVINAGKAAYYTPEAIAGEIEGNNATPAELAAPEKGLTALNQSVVAPFLSGPEKIITSNVPTAAGAAEQAGFNPKEGILPTVAQTGLGALNLAYPASGVGALSAQALDEATASQVLRSFIQSGGTSDDLMGAINDAVSKGAPVAPAAEVAEEELRPTEEPVTPQAAPAEVNPRVTTPEEQSLNETEATQGTALQPATVADPRDLQILSQTGFPLTNSGNAVSDATNDLLRFYDEKIPLSEGNGLNDSLRVGNGNVELGKLLSKRLGKAVKQELPELSDREDLTDLLEGQKKSSEVSDDVNRVAQSIKPLQVRGLITRQAAGKVGEIDQYISHEVKGGLKTPEGLPFKPGKGVNIPGLNRRISGIKDLFNQTSRFSQSRTIGKFVSEDGDVRYGSPESAGMKQHGSTFTYDGKPYQFQQATARELHEANVAKMELDASKLLEDYHADTAGLLVRKTLADHLIKDPGFGLIKLDDVAEIPQGYHEISGIPELRGYAAPDSVASEIEKQLGVNKSSIVGQLWRKPTQIVTQFIVLNPIFHGANQAIQTLIGSGRFSDIGLDGMYRVATSLENRADFEQTVADMFRNGGHSPSYGADEAGVLNKLTHGASKISSRTMSNMELRLRATFYKAGIDAGMAPKDVIDAMDRFLGARNTLGEGAQGAGLFLHYAKTMVEAIGDQIAHPLLNKGTIINTAILGTALVGINKEIQKLTGNKNAYARAPGELGYINDIWNIAKGAYNKNPEPAESVVMGHINPLITEGVEQTFNKDLRTGEKVSQNGRLAHAESTLIAPAQGVNQITAGKRSVGEVGLNQLGISTPHVKGAPAVPNAKGEFATVLNTKGAQAVAPEGTGKNRIVDPTGIAQSNAWYKAVDKGVNSLGSNQDAGSLSTVQKYLARNHNDSGQTIQLSVKESKAQWGDLAGDTKALSTIQQIEKAQPGHDPIWDLPLNKLQIYANYESIDDGDPNRTVLEQKNPWLYQEFGAEQTYFNSNQFKSSSVPFPGNPVYPTISSEQNNLISQVSTLSAIQNRSTDQENQLEDLMDNPQYQVAEALLDKYTNQRRAAEGLQPIPYPAENLTPGQEDLLKQESALPSGTGAKTAFIKANQAEWNNIQQILAQNTIFAVEKYGGVINQGGTEPDFLKDTYEAGQYDIAKPTSNNPAYTLNPALAYTQSSGSGSGSSSSGKINALVALPKRPKAHLIKAGKKPRMVKYRGTKLKQAPKVSSRGVLKPVSVANPAKVLNMK